MYFNRNISEKLEKALKRSPVVLVTGARQTGKTTLVKKIGSNYSFVSFDDIRYLSAVQKDPIGFIENIEKPIIFDEVQRVPEFFLTIKNYVDNNRSNGMFILTGSANPLLVPKLGDSLAGRMEIINLFPLSQGELLNKKEIFLDIIFQNNINSLKTDALTQAEIYKKILTGGYPSVQNINDEDKTAWFESYLTTILQRDVKNLARIEGLAQLPNLLNLIATRTGSLLNNSELSRTSDIANATLQRYLTLLETLFLITLQNPWSTNLGKRLVKSPKIYLTDTGILLHLLNLDIDAISKENQLFGKIFENFIVTELLKQISWNNQKIKMFHYRTQTGTEVDIVLENMSGNLVGIEIKSGQTIKSDDFKGLNDLEKILGKKFVTGIILYTGNKKIPFAKNMWALPVSSLWS